MKILIADWGKRCNGGRYTMFGVEKDTPHECFHAIDTLGNPLKTKYKVLSVKEVFDPDCEGGIESQSHIAEIYTESEKKEQDFSEIDYKSLWL